MSSRTANITSIDAVGALKLALLQYAADVNDAFILLEMEGRRALDWIDNDISWYWPRETLRASDTMSEARMAYERCRLTTVDGNPRECYEERVALEQAKRRLRLAQEKVQSARRWRLRVHKEVEEFEVQMAKLRRLLDSDVTRAIAALDRMSTALADYVRTRAAAESGGPSATASGAPGRLPAASPMPSASDDGPVIREESP